MPVWWWWLLGVHSTCQEKGAYSSREAATESGSDAQNGG